MPNDRYTAAVEAQATLHHALFLGLQLTVSSRESADVIGDWMFRLFRRQHEAKFLSSFAKLGLTELPHAVACARYHVLSNGIGGVPVEYAEESSRKAWVRFRYPRWMFAGPTICGLPVEASLGFLRGWYAHNGVSLNNPRLGFVCVSQDMTGEFGLCGYFNEYDEPIGDDMRLVFKPDEHPPPFDAASQPKPPQDQWTAQRLAKANRNYAVEYLRNGLPTLIDVVGRSRGLELACTASRLIGLQYFQDVRGALDADDGDHQATARFLHALLCGIDENVAIEIGASQSSVTFNPGRLTRGLASPEALDLIEAWTPLIGGLIDSHQTRKSTELGVTEKALTWTIRDRA